MRTTRYLGDGGWKDEWVALPSQIGQPERTTFFIPVATNSRSAPGEKKLPSYNVEQPPAWAGQTRGPRGLDLDLEWVSACGMKYGTPSGRNARIRRRPIGAVFARSWILRLLCGRANQ